MTSQLNRIAQQKNVANDYLNTWFSHRFDMEYARAAHTNQDFEKANEKYEAVILGFINSPPKKYFERYPLERYDHHMNDQKDSNIKRLDDLIDNLPQIINCERTNYEKVGLLEIVYNEVCSIVLGATHGQFFKDRPRVYIDIDQDIIY